MALNPLQLFQKAKENRLTEEDRAWISARLETYPYFSFLHLISARDERETARKRTLGVLHAPNKKLFLDFINDKFNEDLPPPPDHFTPLTLDSGESAPVERRDTPHYNRTIASDFHFASFDAAAGESVATAKKDTFSVSDEIALISPVSTDIAPSPALLDEQVFAAETNGADKPLPEAEKPSTVNISQEFTAPSDAFHWRLNATLDFRVRMFMELPAQIQTQIRRYAPLLSTESLEKKNPAAEIRPAESETTTEVARQPASFVDRFVQPEFLPKAPTLDLAESIPFEEWAAAVAQYSDEIILPTGGGLPPRIYTRSFSRFVTPKFDPKPATLSSGNSMPLDEILEAISAFDRKAAEQISQTPAGEPARPISESAPAKPERVVSESMRRFVDPNFEPHSATLQLAQSVPAESAPAPSESAKPERVVSESMRRFVDPNFEPHSATLQLAQSVPAESAPAPSESAKPERVVSESMRRFVDPNFEPHSATLQLAQSVPAESPPAPTSSAESKIERVVSESMRRFVDPNFEPHSATLQLAQSVPAESPPAPTSSAESKIERVVSESMRRFVDPNFEPHSATLQLAQSVPAESPPAPTSSAESKIERVVSESMRRFVDPNFEPHSATLQLAQSVPAESPPAPTSSAESKIERVVSESMRRFVEPEFSADTPSSPPLRQTMEQKLERMTAEVDRYILQTTEPAKQEIASPPTPTGAKDDKQSVSGPIRITSESMSRFTPDKPTDIGGRIISESMRRFVEPDFNVGTPISASPEVPVADKPEKNKAESLTQFIPTNPATLPKITVEKREGTEKGVKFERISSVSMSRYGKSAPPSAPQSFKPSTMPETSDSSTSAGRERIVSESMRRFVDLTFGEFETNQSPMARIVSESMKRFARNEESHKPVAAAQAPTVPEAPVAAAQTPTVPEAPVAAAQAPTVPEAPVAAAQAPTVPEAPVAAAQTPTVPEAPVAAAQAPTVPEAPVAAAQAPTVPEAPVAAAQTPTVPEAPVAAAQAPTVPEAPVAAAQAPTVPEAPVAAAQAPTVPEAPVAAAQAPTVPSKRIAIKIKPEHSGLFKPGAIEKLKSPIEGAIDKRSKEVSGTTSSAITGLSPIPSEPVVAAPRPVSASPPNPSEPVVAAPRPVSASPPNPSEPVVAAPRPVSAAPPNPSEPVVAAPRPVSASPPNPSEPVVAAPRPVPAAPPNPSEPVVAAPRPVSAAPPNPSEPVVAAPRPVSAAPPNPSEPVVAAPRPVPAAPPNPSEPVVAAPRPVPAAPPNPSEPVPTTQESIGTTRESERAKPIHDPVWINPLQAPSVYETESKTASFPKFSGITTGMDVNNIVQEKYLSGILQSMRRETAVKRQSAPTERSVEIKKQESLPPSNVEAVLERFKSFQPIISDRLEAQHQEAGTSAMGWLSIDDEEEESGAEFTTRGMLDSESLATMYERQGHYRQAIGVYERLKLKYPEKSAYFEAKIKELTF